MRAALDRAIRRRTDYFAQLLREAGQPGDVAARRATLAYATYLGHAQLAHSTPGVRPDTTARSAPPTGRSSATCALSRA